MCYIVALLLLLFFQLNLAAKVFAAQELVREPDAAVQLPTRPNSVNLSIEIAFQKALASNPGWKAELAKTKIADAEILSAAALPNPVLISDNGVAEDSYRLGVQQTILLGGKIKNRVRIAHARKESLTAELRLAFLQLRSDVRNVYAQLYALKERQRILSELLRDYEEFKHITANLEDQVQINFIEASTRNELRNAKYEAELANHNLNALIGNPLETSLILEKPRSSINGNLPLQALIAHAQSDSPGLMQNRAQVQGMQGELALAKANRLPNFSFVLGPDLVTPPEFPQWNVFAIGLMDIPIINRQQGPIKEALARQSQLGLSRQALQHKSVLNVTNAYTTYQHTLDRLHEFERVLIPEALELQAKAKLAHREQKLTVDTLVEADTHRADTELSYLKNLVQNQEAISNLEVFVGKEL